MDSRDKDPLPEPQSSASLTHTNMGNDVHEEPSSWHHGLVATWWAEFNDDFRPNEVAYIREFVEADGRAALDAGCGSGRLLLPFLRDGLDVDGCDASADMIAACQAKAEAQGLQPGLHVQPLHQLDLPRKYGTIYVVGTFGLGSDRARDQDALVRLRDHLEPDGTLLIDLEMPWADSKTWSAWVPGPDTVGRPEAFTGEPERRIGSDGAEYAMSTRRVAVDPLTQRVTWQIRAQRWRDGVLDAEEHGDLHLTMYFPHEMLLMLERAGFTDVAMHGAHEHRAPTAEDRDIVFVAKR